MLKNEYNLFTKKVNIQIQSQNQDLFILGVFSAIPLLFACGLTLAMVVVSNLRLGGQVLRLYQIRDRRWPIQTKSHLALENRPIQTKNDQLWDLVVVQGLILFFLVPAQVPCLLFSRLRDVFLRSPIFLLAHQEMIPNRHKYRIIPDQIQIVSIPHLNQLH